MKTDNKMITPRSKYLEVEKEYNNYLNDHGKDRDPASEDDLLGNSREDYLQATQNLQRKLFYLENRTDPSDKYIADLNADILDEDTYNAKENVGKENVGKKVSRKRKKNGMDIMSMSDSDFQKRFGEV